MRTVIIVLLILFLLFIAFISTCIVGAMDYDPAWDDPEEVSQDDYTG